MKKLTRPSTKEPSRRREFQPLNSPPARFIAAGRRCGDCPVPGAPFAAEIVIENTPRLFDAPSVRKTNRRAVHREREGGTRREPIARRDWLAERRSR